MVSMRQLRYFVEIVEAGSYSLAAERLFVAQSALSRQVKELEASAQVQLLTRGARRFELTQAGKTFYDGAKRLLFNLNETLVQTRHANRGEHGVIRVLHSSSVPFANPLMERIQSYLLANGNVSLEISQMSSEHQGEHIEEGRSDIGFVRLPIHIRYPGVRVKELYTEPLMLAVPVAHRLSQFNEVAVAALREESFVSLPHGERGGLSYRVAELCMRNGFFPRAARATSRKTTQLSLVEAQLGIAVVPASMRSIAPAGVRFVSLKGTDNSTAVAMLYRRETSALVDGFAATLQGANWQ
ncbi:DNA-binding transcriptional LysR family regulator [Paraburkholderia terricola]|uniref:LysR family transcriptional regulator n=1 Tax=Paraburkholderia terricola TaxID=169427 RepID=UPI002854F47C|nr:LysR family transcriptional regulator [Paraburkholderia terricola]MDR6450445.1 DNA-binding transcriptional LysR family regulator [Paraburkholderia terricola]MDR6484877.1 DNA-binding transcriptional LysR family regulator [Paraburkholderia terricola]MDR6495713.1 DNA-binding transcriptional LysR family regulator [Paraburkholderia terricola]